jgi:hypothetical protein
MPSVAAQKHPVAFAHVRGRAIGGDLPHATRRAGDTFLCVLLFVYLGSLAFEGPLRYALFTAGVPNALYVRDAIPVGTLAFLFLRSLFVDETLEPLIAIPIALLVFHGALAAMWGVALFSIFFGFKIFMFIPYGMAMWPLVRSRLDEALTAAAILFFITLSGVMLNFILQRMPWEGLEYDTAFGAVTATRLWWVPGMSRLPGFTRTSFNAAMILGTTGLLTMVKLQRPTYRWVVAVLAFVAIVATTSKGMVLAFPVAAGWLLFERGETQHPKTGRALVWLLFSLTLALPLLVVFYGLASTSSSSLPPLLFSVSERFSLVWPEAFGLLSFGPQSVLGAGLGGIGTPQLFGHSPHRFNPGDNMAIYFIITFGVLGLAYYLVPALRTRHVAQAETPSAFRAYIALLLIAYGYGVSNNMVEESFFAIVFGICLGIACGTPRTPYNVVR